MHTLDGRTEFYRPFLIGCHVPLSPHVPPSEVNEVTSPEVTELTDIGWPRAESRHQMIELTLSYLICSSFAIVSSLYRSPTFVTLDSPSLLSQRHVWDEFVWEFT